MTGPKRGNPAGQGWVSGTAQGEQTFYAQNATAEPLLQRLDGIQKAGDGHRARCPACGGASRKLTVTERDGRVLLHCFGGCRAIEVLEAVGLSWASIMPPRTWPESPEDRRKARKAIREAGWASAVAVLALEANVALLAARQLARWQYLEPEDDARLAQAAERIDHAASVLVEVRR